MKRSFVKEKQRPKRIAVIEKGEMFANFHILRGNATHSTARVSNKRPPKQSLQRSVILAPCGSHSQFSGNAHFVRVTTNNTFTGPQDTLRYDWVNQKVILADEIPVAMKIDRDRLLCTREGYEVNGNRC